eukprot:gnl/Spiro4/22446_TR11064_c0_g1_i1.p2 gnl/Spiro4/22446_TR11064_c0_g1~~gnl/Spiro4/22446_TR11064_c0_g1_i1.p2  ORF type:complete len:304 (-),score=-40.72 gnl/Spiro4/22446_TR11064_c0_g1_i1:1719-2630(-)
MISIVKNTFKYGHSDCCKHLVDELLKDSEAIMILVTYYVYKYYRHNDIKYNWYPSIDNIDDKYKKIIINMVCEYGTLDMVKNIVRKYGKKIIGHLSWTVISLVCDRCGSNNTIVYYLLSKISNLENINEDMIEKILRTCPNNVVELMINNVGKEKLSSMVFMNNSKQINILQLLTIGNRIKFVDNFSHLLEKTSSDGNNALILACMYSDIFTVDKLLKMGANINHKNNKNRSALFYVYKNKCPTKLSTKIIKKIIDGTKGLTERDTKGFNIMHIAKYRSDVEVKYLEKRMNMECEKKKDVSNI